MKMPKMILFDYGQTLVNEEKFNGVKGTEAVMQYAVRNEYHMNAEQIQAYADQINEELGRYDPVRSLALQAEIPNSEFSAYLYEALGIELGLDDFHRDKIFWDAAAPGKPTEGMEAFLAYLEQKGIRTGVVSNISYGSEALEDRINRMLPQNRFEFIIATSKFLFRKPNRHIFELALKKAGLQPEEVWFIGDNYKADVLGAKGAGLFPIWYKGAIRTSAEEQEDVCSVSSWAELTELMEKAQG